MSSFLNKGPINLCYHNPMFLLYIKYQWLSCDFCGGETSEDEKVHRVQKVQMGKVLKIDRPAAGGFLSLTGPLAPRVADCPSGNAYKISVTDLLSVSYGMISITSISHLRWLFPPLVPYGTAFPPRYRSGDKRKAPLWAGYAPFFARLAHPMQDVHSGQ